MKNKLYNAANAELEQFFKAATQIPFFEFMDIQNIDAVNSEGENALHLAIVQNNVAISKLLIDAGININQHGELGQTPLHIASSFGHTEIVKLLVEAGADLFALTEGNPPFTLARFGKHDEICDYLGVEMKKAQTKDPQIWIRARISQLTNELSRLKVQLHK